VRVALRALGALFLLNPIGRGSLTAQVDSASDSGPRPYRGRLLVLPYVTYSPQTRLQVGVGGGYQFKWPGARSDTATRGSYLAGNLAYTTKGQWLTSAAASLYLPRNRWWISGGAAAGFFPAFYYGIGPRTTAADTNLLQQHFLAADVRVLRRVHGNLSAGAQYRIASYERVEWQFSSRIPVGLPGGTGGVSSGLGVMLQLDSRNSVATPTRGHFLSAELTRYSSLLGSDFQYTSLAFDARNYFRVRRGRDLVAIGLYAQFNGRNVPIQSMAMLGGYTSQVLMRGVYLGRFRDRHQLVAQADFRGHLRGRLGYVLFGSAGNVYGSAGAGAFDKVKFTHGVGLRFDINPADPLNIRVDYTWTSFGARGLSLGAGEAF
jgi:Omp85 superfamily domain